MKTMYLKDGRMVDLISEDVNGKALVAPYIEIHESTGNGPDDWQDIWDQSPGRNMIFVEKSELTERAPVEVYDKEIISLKDEHKKLAKECLEKNHELSAINHLINNAKQTLVSNDKFIINKSDLINATTIALFGENEIMPLVMDKSKLGYNGFRGLKISMEIKFNGEERAWGYQLYDDNSRSQYSSGEFLCPKYGIIINPTKEQIDAIIKERLKDLSIDDTQLIWKLRGVPEEFLTPEMVAKKKERKVMGIKNEIEKKKREEKSIADEIIKKTEELAKLG